MARLRKEGGESEEGRAGFGVGVACETVPWLRFLPSLVTEQSDPQGNSRAPC